MNLDPNTFVKLLNVNVFIDIYNQFLGLFPASTHWLVSLIILISIVAALFILISTNWLFLILAVILLPVIYPVLKNFFTEIYSFILYLWHIVGAGLPKT